MLFCTWYSLLLAGCAHGRQTSLWRSCLERVGSTQSHRARGTLFLASREASLDLSPHLLHPLVGVDGAANACVSAARQNDAWFHKRLGSQTDVGRQTWAEVRTFRAVMLEHRHCLGVVALQTLHQRLRGVVGPLHQCIASFVVAHVLRGRRA
jgi:hypothetical protein